MRQKVAAASSPVLGGPLKVSTMMCIDERPVWTTRARTSTR